jgi:hypothetical protein
MLEITTGTGDKEGVSSALVALGKDIVGLGDGSDRPDTSDGSGLSLLSGPLSVGDRGPLSGVIRDTADNLPPNDISDTVGDTSEPRNWSGGLGCVRQSGLTHAEAIAAGNPEPEDAGFTIADAVGAIGHLLFGSPEKDEERKRAASKVTPIVPPVTDQQIRQPSHYTDEPLSLPASPDVATPASGPIQATVGTPVENAAETPEPLTLPGTPLALPSEPTEQGATLSDITGSSGPVTIDGLVTSVVDVPLK